MGKSNSLEPSDTIRGKLYEHCSRTTQPIDTVSIAADIVAAYVSNNPLPVGELPKLIGDIHAALQGLGTPVTEPAASRNRRYRSGSR